MADMTTRFASDPNTRQALRNKGANLPYAEGIDPPSLAPKTIASISRRVGDAPAEDPEEARRKRLASLRRAGATETILSAPGAGGTYSNLLLGDQE